MGSASEAVVPVGVEVEDHRRGGVLVAGHGTADGDVAGIGTNVDAGAPCDRGQAVAGAHRRPLDPAHRGTPPVCPARMIGDVAAMSVSVLAQAAKAAALGLHPAR
jgi:hypothetical protein